MRRIIFRNWVKHEWTEWVDGILIKITDLHYFIELTDGTLESKLVDSCEIKFNFPIEQTIKEIKACSQIDMSNWDVEDILKYGVGE
jgi:hypothetical protein